MAHHHHHHAHGHGGHGHGGHDHAGHGVGGHAHEARGAGALAGVGLSGHSQGDSDYQHMTRPGASRALVIALCLVGAFTLVEFLGALWSGSLALMADSGHMLTDAASLAFSLFANIVAQRPASSRHSYGLARAEVIAAFVNSLALLAIVVWFVVLAVDRIAHPVAVNGEAVSLIAAAGVAVNLLVAWVLSHDQHNVNVRAVLLHVMGDLLGSIAALVAGLVVIYTGYYVVDPLLSMLVSGLILRSTVGVLRESTLILLDSVPHSVDFEDVGKALASIPGVVSVHDLHIWNMVPGQAAASAHLLIDDMAHWPAILGQARLRLNRDYRIGHVTFQPESLSASRGTVIPIRPA